MEYSLKQLEHSIKAFKFASDAKHYADQIKHLAYTISEGNTLTAKQVDKLTYIINLINSDQALKWIVYDGLRQKLWQCVYRGREAIASSFYETHGKDTQQLNGIDFHKRVVKKTIAKDTVLYQWCRMLLTNDGAVLYDSNTKNVTIGEYFSETKVPQEQLGINPYHDVKDPSGKSVTTTNRVCCSFKLPFAVDCLLTTAKGTFDEWSVAGMRRYAVGGKEQYYIPLSKDQKIKLAQIAQFE